MINNKQNTVNDNTVGSNGPTVFLGSLKPSQNPSEKQNSPSLKTDNIIVYIVKKIINFFFDFLETSVVALSIFVVVYLFLVQPHEIKGSSMEPNFHNNEYILTDKISYKFREPQRGEVIIFKAPTNNEVDYIKRVIGLPGDRIKVQDGFVYVNEMKLNESYLADKTPLLPGSSMQEGVEITIPPDHIFVMGDNRPHSSDSREFGPVSFNLIIGHAIFRYWPLPEMGLISTAKY